MTQDGDVEEAAAAAEDEIPGEDISGVVVKEKVKQENFSWSV